MLTIESTSKNFFFVYSAIFITFSNKSLAHFRFKLLQSSKQRKPEVALYFAFDHCEGNVNRGLSVLEVGRGLVSLNRQEGSWALGTRVFKQPSHDKLLANSCWQARVGVCERHNNGKRTCQGHPTEYFGKISVRMEGRLRISNFFGKP